MTDTRYVILRGDPAVVGAGLKHNVLLVILKFMEQAGAVRCEYGEHSVLVTVADAPGDVQWVMDNVFRYTDVYGTNTPQEAAGRAAKAWQRLLDTGGDRSRVGRALLDRWLGDLYLTYDVYPAPKEGRA